MRSGILELEGRARSRNIIIKGDTGFMKFYDAGFGKTCFKASRDPIDYKVSCTFGLNVKNTSCFT